MASDSWIRNYEVIEEIESIEDSLKEEYFKKRYKEESRALEKMEKDSSYFFKYARRFGKKEGSIPSLKGPRSRGLESDGCVKAQILNTQYSSVWSKPLCELNEVKIREIFNDCEDCLKEKVHECRSDQISEAIISHREAIMEFSRTNNTLSKKEYILGEMRGKWHDVEVFEKMIDTLKLGASCGPDGLSAEAIKRLRTPIARFLHLIFHSSMKVGRFPENLKHA